MVMVPAVRATTVDSTGAKRPEFEDVTGEGEGVGAGDVAIEFVVAQIWLLSAE